jgi:hypothetical protein
MLTTVYNKKTVILAIVLISFAFAVYAEDDNEIDIDKIKQSNPFAQFAGKQMPNARPDEPKPELFVETVTLKFLDAKSLKVSISNMSSTYGSVEPDGKILQKFLSRFEKLTASRSRL